MIAPLIMSISGFVIRNGRPGSGAFGLPAAPSLSLVRDASMEAVISLWRPGMGTPPTCALLHNCEVLKPSRRAVDLTAAEVLEKLVPSTEHLSIGIYGNDLCLVWSKAGVGASIS